MTASLRHPIRSCGSDFHKRRPLALIGTVAVLSAGLIALAQPASASPSSTVQPGAGRIYFVSNATGHFQIYSMTSRGGNVRRLTSAGYDHLQPSVSADGREIAFAADPDGTNRHIFEMRTDAVGGERQLTSAAGSQDRPAWDPAGGRIAYASTQTGSSNIWLMKPDGTQQHDVTADQTTETFPAWSPDATTLAFASDRAGATPGAVSAIYLAQPDGSQPTRITPLTLNAGDESFSPDGQQLTFVNNLCNTCGNGAVFTMNRDGTAVHRVTHLLSKNLGGPRWSPDGTHIAFWGGIWIDNPKPQDIYTMAADGSQLRNLTDTPTVNDSDPLWITAP